MNSDELLFLVADEEQVNEVVQGRTQGSWLSWAARYPTRFSANEVGVLARSREGSRAIQPLALVVPDDGQRRLYGRFSSLRSEFSPLSSWCHVFDTRLFESFEGTSRDASLSGFDASWGGLVVAEAALLSGRSAEKLKIAACLATATFAIARTISLWPRMGIQDILERYDGCNRVIRNSGTVTSELSRRLAPIWSALLEASEAAAYPSRRTSHALAVLREARVNGIADEHRSLIDALGVVQDFEFLSHLDEIGPEERVSIFDHFIVSLGAEKNRDRRETLAFLAGYLATVAAGGMPSLGLAEQVSKDWPEVLAWAYVIGGIGEEITWTSSFDGLGRLVCRELTRTFHIDEPPTCDFGYDEAALLVDRQLNDPLVHLKIKQQRTVLVALFPGVNIAIPLTDSPDLASNAPPVRQSNTNTNTNRSARELDQLVNALWPLIVNRLLEDGFSPDSKQTRNTSARKRGAQGKLPLDR